MASSPRTTFQFDGVFDIPTVRKDASALAVHAGTGHLWTITDDDVRLVEFTDRGQFVREVKLPGFEDAEGLCSVDGNRFLVAEEKAFRITLIELSVDSATVQRVHPGIELNVKSKKNKGLEGVSYDAKSDTMYAVREDKPPTVFRVQPLFGTSPRDTRDWPLDLDDFDDLSDSFFDPSSGWLWLLSHESRLAAAFDSAGVRVLTIELKKGRHGLPEDVEQAEGIARDRDGTLFVCSEPNRVYRFRPV